MPRRGATRRTDPVNRIRFVPKLALALTSVTATVINTAGRTLRTIMRFETYSFLKKVQEKLRPRREALPTSAMLSR
jgi:hypothetical protein